jgi:methylmalonyl-CoA mutase, N-terminal domain
MVAAIEKGWVQREIEDAAYQHQRAVDSGETVVVGVNRFAGPDDDVPGVRAGEADGTSERMQVERVRALRARRDPVRWRAAIERVRDEARSSGNVMPTIVEAVESDATVGEIAGSLREVFGEFRGSEA